MQQCPYCDAILDEVSLITNVCSSCNEVLGEISQTMRTLRVDSRTPLSTLEVKTTLPGVKTIITSTADDDGLPDDLPSTVPASSSMVLNRRSFSEEKKDGKSETDYVVIKKIGEGGMGVVEEARQNSLNRIVAIKILGNYKGSDAASNFTREAKVTGSLEHPNIVPIYDLGTDEKDKPFYAMKRIQGRSWSAVLEEKSLTENIDILLHVCDAVAYAHSRGIIHRDLKPENVMLGDYGEILLMDWGLAAGMWEGAAAPRVRYEDAIAGTPAYMAPEMARGEEDVIGFQSDVYLLGAILFEIITGEQPHNGSSINDCLAKASENKLVDAWVDSQLLKTAKKAMASRPEDRFANVRELQDAIRTNTQSIMAATRARQAHSKAAKTGNYLDYFRSIGGYMEALEIWGGNEEARKALDGLVLEFAGIARVNGDLHLAESLLDVKNEQHTVLIQRIREERRSRT